MTSLFSGINSALRALLANQQAIQVIEHNIANANTPGYHRQEAVLAAGEPYPAPGFQPFLASAGQIGTGVMVERIRRFNLDFYDVRYRKELGATSYWRSQNQALSQVEMAFSETGNNGLAAKLDRFWAGWQAVSDDPGSSTARSEVIDRGQGLATAFNQRAESLLALQANQDRAILQRVEEINQAARQFAQLNAEITRVLAAGHQPNDLLDKRDLLLERLSEIAGASANLQENGQMMVSLGGHALVVGTETFTLIATPDPDNRNLARISWASGQAFNPTPGELAGLLEARDQLIPEQISSLNSLASALINRVNALHQQGYGTNNSHGLNFFEGNDALSMRLDGQMNDPSNLATAADQDLPGDSTIARALAGVKDELLMLDGRVTLNEVYQAQAGKLGMAVKRAGDEAQTHQMLAGAMQQQRESVSGVSLDEEAATLVRYQRSYQAVARLLTTLDEMADRVINGMGRVGL